MNRLLQVRMLAAVSATALCATVPSGAASQTPEQRYADWARPDFPAVEYKQRRARLLDRVASSGGGVLLVPSGDGAPGSGTFRQLDDFWYLTGLELPGSMLILDSDAGSSFLFLPTRDPRFENPGRRNDFPGRPLGDDPALVRLAGVDGTGDVADLPAALADWAAANRTLRIDAGHRGALETPVPPLIGSLDPIESLLLRIRTDFPNARLANAFEAVAQVRMIKTQLEVEALQRAADATMAAIRTTARSIRPGVDERTLQGVFEAACRANGAQAIPFTPIIKSGANSLWPWRVLAAHYDRRNRTVADGDLVIQDVGCEVNGYISDIGRTFPAGGHFTEVQREKLLVSTRAADAIIAAARPGVTLGDLTAIAYETIPAAERAYMQTASYFGHHIGLSSGDPALMDVALAPGMVFTVEPWYYNHDLGVSVFVEDVIVITERGAELLTRSLPRTPEALERMIG